MTNRSSQIGLTLIETLVALAILATVAVSALALLSQSTRFAASEQDRLIAAIVADNMLVSELARAAPPTLGETTDVVTLAGRSWAYTQTVMEAGEQARFVAISVRRNDSPQILATASTVKEVK